MTKISNLTELKSHVYSVTTEHANDNYDSHKARTQMRCSDAICRVERTIVFVSKNVVVKPKSTKP